jgi:hypothetical protein
MKKYILHINGIITAGILLTFPLQSASSKIYLGGKSGIAYSSIVQQLEGLNYRSGQTIGWSVAAMADIPARGRFSFRPELAFAYQGGSFLGGSEQEGYRWKHIVEAYSLQPTFHLAYNIPILDVQMTVFLGPALDFQLSSSLASKPIGNNETPAINQSLTPFDIAASGGISVEYSGVFFSIATWSGLIDRRRIMSDSDTPVFQNNLTFSLGYFFR